MGLCLKHLHSHPELLIRTDVLLNSINDRLGALCSRFECSAGQDLVPLSSEMFQEILAWENMGQEEDDEDPMQNAPEEGEDLLQLRRLWRPLI